MTIQHHTTRAMSGGARRPPALVARRSARSGPAALAETTVPDRHLAHTCHELRTPLQAVLGYATLLQDGAGGTLPRSAAHMIDQIARNAQHMRELVDDLLDLARLDAGRVGAATGEVDLEALVGDALAALAPQARAKRLALAVRMPDARVPAVRTDATRVRQIVLNLAANAVKFTEHGGVTVALEAQGSRVAVHVLDTGIGIAAPDHERVFDEFVQVGAGGGVGLGLAISRRLARLLGGDLTLRSEPGQGSCFTLTLPVQRPAETRDDRA